MAGFENIINNTTDLGKLIRAKRKSSGASLQQTSANSDIGVRFLSELERGKDTAEIGKVLSALHAVGLDLVVVKKPTGYRNASDNSENANLINESAINYYSDTNYTPLSTQLDLEFPYDWSNPDIEETAFIQLVLAKTRFNDILKISHHFGISRIETEVSHFIDTPQYDIIVKLISHIRAGIKLASS